MQTYLGLKPRRKPAAAAPPATAASITGVAPVAEDAVSRAIELLHEEFFSTTTGMHLKHVFTAAQVCPPAPSLSTMPNSMNAAHFLRKIYSIVSDRSAVDCELQSMVNDGSLRRFRNIGSRSGDDDFFMRSVNYTAALQRRALPSRPPSLSPSMALGDDDD
jgi:hypothetical protein